MVHSCFLRRHQQNSGTRVQGSSLEQVLSRVEDAVLMLQGTSYMLAEKGSLLHARRRRLPPSARVTSPPSPTDVCGDHAVTPYQIPCYLHAAIKVCMTDVMACTASCCRFDLK